MGALGGNFLSKGASLFTAGLVEYVVRDPPMFQAAMRTSRPNVKGPEGSKILSTI